MVKASKRVLHFYNDNGSLDNIVAFLEIVKKKVNYINLSVDVQGIKSVKVTLSGPKDLQYLAVDRLRELANQYLES